MKHLNWKPRYVMLAWLLAAGVAVVEAAERAVVDLRPKFEQWQLGERRQGKRGTCSVFAVTGALEFAVAAKDGRGTRLSSEFLNWADRCGKLSVVFPIGLGPNEPQRPPGNAGGREG